MDLNKNISQKANGMHQPNNLEKYIDQITYMCKTNVDNIISKLAFNITGLQTVPLPT